jgi:hypothetical protein
VSTNLHHVHTLISLGTVADAKKREYLFYVSSYRSTQVFLSTFALAIRKISSVVLLKYRYLQANNSDPEFSTSQLQRKAFFPTLGELTKC